MWPPIQAFGNLPMAKLATLEESISMVLRWPKLIHGVAGSQDHGLGCGEVSTCWLGIIDGQEHSIIT